MPNCQQACSKRKVEQRNGIGNDRCPMGTTPGQRSKHVPVETSEDGKEVFEEDENNRILDNDHEGEEQQVKLREGPDRFHISQKAVNRYGTTFGCPACRELERRGHTSGRFGYNHNGTCRQRISEEMTKDPEHRSLVDKHGNMRSSEYGDVATVEKQ